MKRFKLVLYLAVLMAPCVCSAGRSQRDPISHETETRHARPRMAGEIFDPQETDPRLRSIFADADLQAEYSVRNVPRDKRFVFRFWIAKKTILKQKHRIDWKTPAELNPNIKYESYGQPAITDREAREISAMMGRQLRGKHENVLSIERTFDGATNVWTKVGNTDECGKYVVVPVNGGWKIVDRQRVVP